MPFSLQCACGAKLTIRDDLAGTQGECPACGQALALTPPIVVEESPEIEFSLDTEPKPPPMAPQAARRLQRVATRQAASFSRSPIPKIGKAVSLVFMGIAALVLLAGMASFLIPAADKDNGFIVFVSGFGAVVVWSLVWCVFHIAANSERRG